MNTIQYYWAYISPFPLTSGSIERRLDALKEKADGYLESLQVHMEQDGPDTTRNTSKCDVTVKVDALKSNNFMSALTATRTIYIHPLMLLKPSDIPWDLNYIGNDYTLYISRLSKWISEKFKIEEKDLEQIKHAFLYYLYMWQNPKALHLAQEFILAHEVGHLQQMHVSFPWEFPLAFILSTLVFDILVACSITSIPLALGAAIPTLLISFIVLRYFRILSSKGHETEADLIGYKLTGTTKGAEIFFESMHRIEVITSKNSPWYQKMYRTYFHNVHPAPKDRLTAIQEAHLLEHQQFAKA